MCPNFFQMTISPYMGLKVQTFLTLPNSLLSFRLFKKILGGFHRDFGSSRRCRHNHPPSHSSFIQNHYFWFVGLIYDHKTNKTETSVTYRRTNRHCQLLHSDLGVSITIQCVLFLLETILLNSSSLPTPTATITTTCQVSYGFPISLHC